MPKNIAVGLDIGTSSIKVVQVRRVNKQQVVLEHFGRTPTPYGSLEGGAIQNPQVIADYIRKALNDARIKTKDAVIAVAGQTVIVRHIKFPFMEEQELRSTMKFEAERYIPYPIDEAAIDFEIISRDSTNNETEVMLVAAQKQLLESHIQSLKLAGVQPLAIDVQPFALIRALGLGDNASPGAKVILDIGAGTTDLLIYKGGSPRFTRIIPIAGNSMTQAIAAAFSCSVEDAETLKIQYGNIKESPDSSDNEVRVRKAIRGTLEELVLEVRRSIEYYRLQQRIDSIEQIIISGGGARLANCEEYFAQELGIRVIRGNPLNLLHSGSITSEAEDIAPILAVGIGLALREVE